MKYFQFYFQALDIPELDDMEQPTKPDPDKYFFERPSSEKKLPKLPALADSKYCYESSLPVTSSYNHGGESRDILHLYSDRTGKNIRHYFFNTQCIFIR